MDMTNSPYGREGRMCIWIPSSTVTTRFCYNMFIPSIMTLVPKRMYTCTQYMTGEAQFMLYTYIL
jgi:hypothetical protein